MSSLPLTRTVGTVKDTVSWVRVPDAVGYRFTNHEGKLSHTWDPARTSVKVETGKAITVETLLLGPSGVDPSVVVPPPAGGFTGWDVSLRPAFTPSRTIAVTSRAQLDASLSDLRAGDLLDVRVAAGIQGQLNLGGKHLASAAEIHFNDTAFTGNGGKALNCAWIKDSANLRVYGGRLSNPTGHGIRIEDSDVSWWDFHIDGIAGTGVQAFGLTKPCKVDVRGDIARNGGDLSLDPHAEKGTGLHGVYIGAGTAVTSGTVIVRTHDLPAGHGVEVGTNSDVTVEVDAARLTMVATQQVGGAALCAWGSGVKVNARWLFGDKVSRMVEPDALGSGSVTVKYARCASSRLAPYPAHNGVVYQDIG